MGEKHKKDTSGQNIFLYICLISIYLLIYSSFKTKGYSVLLPGWSSTVTAHCTVQMLPLDRFLEHQKTKMSYPTFFTFITSLTN